MSGYASQQWSCEVGAGYLVCGEVGMLQKDPGPIWVCSKRFGEGYPPTQSLFGLNRRMTRNEQKRNQGSAESQTPHHIIWIPIWGEKK